MLSRLNTLVGSKFIENNMNQDTDDRLSTKLNHLVQKAVDEAIERHRINGESIAISENGEVKIIPPEAITPLAEKLKSRMTNDRTKLKSN